MQLRDISIKNRLNIGFGLCIAVIALLCLILFKSTERTDVKVSESLSAGHEKMVSAQKIINAVNGAYTSLATIALAKDDDHLDIDKEKENLSDFSKTYMEELGKLEKMGTTDKEKGIVTKCKEMLEKAQPIHNRIIELASGKRYAEASQLYLNEARPLSKELAGTLEEMARYGDQSMNGGLKEILNISKGIRIYLLAFGIAAIVLAAVLSLVIGKSIIVPIGHMAYLAERLASGDLTTEARLGRATRDEYGVVKTALISVWEKWRALVTDMKSAAGNISLAAQELIGNAQQMSKGSDEQADRSSQVATASEEMSQTILDIAKNVSNIARSASDTVVVAKEGDKIVTKSVDKVKEIANIVDDSAVFVKSLGERSKQIGDIVNVINDIADQTNLLALNAAIEAARAGEQGRGFAVVADEVRKLAERTAKSTSEIGGMIRGIQDEVSKAVHSMENATSNVDVGVELVTQAGSALQAIVKSADDLQLMVQQIASAADEMSATSEEINRDIEHIASISKETCATALQVEEASKRLADLSENMETATNQFKL